MTQEQRRSHRCGSPRHALVDKDKTLRQDAMQRLQTARDKYRDDLKKISEMTNSQDTKGLEILARVTSEVSHARDMDNKVLELLQAGACGAGGAAATDDRVIHRHREAQNDSGKSPHIA